MQCDEVCFGVLCYDVCCCVCLCYMLYVAQLLITFPGILFSLHIHLNVLTKPYVSAAEIIRCETYTGERSGGDGKDSKSLHHTNNNHHITTTYDTKLKQSYDIVSLVNGCKMR